MGGSGGGGTGGSFGGGGGSARIDTFNAVIDDLSRGTVIEDWIPADPRLQTRMFRLMYSRNGIERNIIDTINDLIWSDFEFVGLKDEVILDTYNASKEATKVHTMMPAITTEHLVTGLCVAQLHLDQSLGIWRDISIHERDNLMITPIPRIGYQPLIDVMPTPAEQRWAKSTDPRVVATRANMPRAFIEQMASSKPLPMDPAITAYMPHREFFNDFMGTSYYVRNLTMWAFEKSLINATMVGHRRRSGPITQVAVGSDTFEATADQIDGYVAALIGAEEDSISSVIGTRHDVAINTVRGGLQEMWKWQDEVDFITTFKLRNFGFNDSFLQGDASLDLTSQPTIFLERLKARRLELTQEFLLNKFCRSLAKIHNFRQRSPAQLAHRIRIDHEDDDLIIPSIRFKRNLDAPVDQSRVEVLEKMEEKGLFVPMRDWNDALGGGDFMERMRAASADLDMRLRTAQLTRMSEKVKALKDELVDKEEAELAKEVLAMRKELAKIHFNDDDEPTEIAKLDDSGRRRAAEVTDGEVSGQYVHPTSTRVIGGDEHDALLDRTVTSRYGYNRSDEVA